MSYWLVLLTLAWSPADETVVENQRVPTGQAYTMVFEEDLRFGADEDSDDYLWASTKVDLAVNDKGHIFVADPKTNELREFDTKGKFIRKVAGPGPGPGELVAIAQVQFINNGQLLVFEQKPMVMPRVQVFDDQGKFVEVKSPTSMSVIPIGAHFSPKGTHYTGAVMLIDPAQGSLVTKTGISELSSFGLIKEFSSFARKVDFNQMGNPAVVADMIGGVINGFYAGAGVFTYDAEGNLYTCMSNKYEVTKWDPEMSKKLLVTNRAYKPIAIDDAERLAVTENVADEFRNGPLASMVTEEFIQRVMKKADIPQTKDPIMGLGVTEDGHMLVVHDIITESGEQTVDIFSKDGKYLGQVTRGDWSFVGRNREFRMIFKNGFAYTVETDEEDDNRVVRYRYKFIKK